MNILSRFCPSDAILDAAGRSCWQIVVVVALTALVCRALFRHRPAARHAAWLAALIFVPLAPLVGVAVDTAGWKWSVARPRMALTPVNQQVGFPAAMPMEFSPSAEATRGDAFAHVPTAREGGNLPNESERVGSSMVAAGSPPVVQPMEAAPGDWLRALAGAAAILWLTGVCYFLVRLIRGWIAVRRICIAAERLDTEGFAAVLERVRRDVGLSRLPPILTSPCIGGPIVARFWRPAVVLPNGLPEHVSADQLASVLVHECAHVVRRDTWVGLLQRLVEVVFWPHPGVHYLNRQLGRAREEVCDNFVIERSDAPNYAETLLALTERYARQAAPATALAFFASRGALADRVAGLLDSRRSRKKRASPLVLLSVAALLFLAGGATAAARFDDGAAPTEQAARPALAPETAAPGATLPATDPPKAADGARRDLYGDPLPAGALLRLGTVRWRHESLMRDSLVFAPVSQRLVAVSGSGHAIRFWDPSTGAQVDSLDVSPIFVRQIAFSADGRRLAAVGSIMDEERVAVPSALRVWDVGSHAQVADVQWKWDRDREPKDLLFLDDGATILVSGDRDGTLRIFDVANEVEVLAIKLCDKRIESMVLSPDRRIVAAAVPKEGVYLWDWQAAGAPRKLIDVVGSDVSVAFSPSGETLLVGCNDHSAVSIYEVATGRQLQSLEPERIGPLQIALSPDGTFAAASSHAYKVIRLWDVASGNELPQINVAPLVPQSIAVSPDSKRIATLVSHNRIRVWNAGTGESIGDEFKGHDAELVGGISFSSDGRLVATGGFDGTLRLWDASTGRQLLEQRHDNPFVAVAISPDGTTLASSSNDDTVRLWNAVDGRELYRLPGHRRLGRFLRLVKFTSDGRKLVSWGGADMYLRVWDVENGKALAEHDVQPAGVNFRPDDENGIEVNGNELLVEAGAISADANVMAMAYQNTVFVYDTMSGHDVVKIAIPPGFVSALALSRDGARLATSQRGKPIEKKLRDGAVQHTTENERQNTVRIWDLKTGRELRHFQQFPGGPGGMAFSHDGRLLASSGGWPEPVLQIWGAESGKQVLAFDGLGSRVQSVEFMADGARLGVGLQNGHGLILDIGATAP